MKFKVGDKIKYIGETIDKQLENKILTITCIDDNYVGMDITEWYPDKREDGYYNGSVTNWPIRYRNKIQFELVSEQEITPPVKKLTVAEEWGF